MDYFRILFGLLGEGVAVSARSPEWQEFWGGFALEAAVGPTVRCGVLAAMAVPEVWRLALQQQDPVAVAQFVSVMLRRANLAGSDINLEARHGEWWAISTEPFHCKFAVMVRAPLGKSDQIRATSRPPE